MQILQTAVRKEIMFFHISNKGGDSFHHDVYKICFHGRFHALNQDLAMSIHGVLAVCGSLRKANMWRLNNVASWLMTQFKPHSTLLLVSQL